MKHLLSRIYRLQLKLGFGPNKNGWEMGFRKSGLGNDMGSRPPSGPSYKACPGIRSRGNSITVNFTKLWPQMFRTSLRNSQVRCGVQKFIMRFTNQFVNYAFDWLLLLQGPIRDFVYKLACEFQYELPNFATNFATKFGTFVFKVSWNRL